MSDRSSSAAPGAPGAAIDKALEGALKRQRAVVLGALCAVAAAAWAYILAGAGMDMAMVAQWDLGYAGVMFAMWWVMMVAMMLPSAAPMLLLFAAMNRKQRESGNTYVPTALFAAAYLLVWAAFSSLAVALQWGLESAALLSPALSSASAVLGGVLLAAAGLYQLTPLKQACLKHCRSPLSFVMGRWRGGPGGAFRMGIEHGAYCVGCCWFLMGLLFFGGVMNLYWIAGLAAFVLLEKTVPAGHWAGRAVGLGLLAWGLAVLANTVW
jgi:predicted metal-binding membrane protein